MASPKWERRLLTGAFGVKLVQAVVGTKEVLFTPGGGAQHLRGKILGEGEGPHSEENVTRGRFAHGGLRGKCWGLGLLSLSLEPLGCLLHGQADKGLGGILRGGFWERGNPDIKGQWGRGRELLVGHVCQGLQVGVVGAGLGGGGGHSETVGLLHEEGISNQLVWAKIIREVAQGRVHHVPGFLRAKVPLLAARLGHRGLHDVDISGLFGSRHNGLPGGCLLSHRD